MKNLKAITVICLMLVSCFFLVKCCEKEEAEQGVEFEISYPGTYYLFFVNTYNNEKKGHLQVNKGDYTFTEKELEEKIGGLHILQIQIGKGIDEDLGDLILNVYDNRTLIDTVVLPNGVKETKVDYIF